MRGRPHSDVVVVAAAAVLVLTACNRTPSASDRESPSGVAGQSPQSNSAQAQPAAGRAAVQTISVQTATVPLNGCDWIPAAEVETIVGQFSKPPEPIDDCQYTLVMPEAIRALRAKELQTYQNSTGEMAALLAKKTKEASDPAKYAMTLSVNLSGGIEVQLANDALAKMFASDLGGGNGPAGSAFRSGGRADRSRLGRGRRYPLRIQCPCRASSRHRSG